MFDGEAHYKSGAVMKSLLMRNKCGIFIIVQMFTDPALSIEAQLDTQ